MNKNKKIIFPLLFLIIIIGVFIFYEFNYSDENIFNRKSNNNDDFELYYDIEEKYIKFNDDNITMIVGDTKKLNIDTNCNVEYKSSNEEVATVDNEGNIKALKQGSVIINVSDIDSDTSNTITINISNKEINVTGINTSTKLIKLEVNKSINISNYITISPMNATNKNVIYNSSNTSIVYIDKYGNITGRSEGNTRINIITKDGNYSTYIDINVYNKEHKLNIIGTNNIDVGKSSKLSTNINSNNIKWSSSNNNIATIDSKGNVKCITYGTTTIKATIDNISNTHNIKCNNTISLDKNSITTYSSMYSTSGMPSSIISFSTTDNIKNIKVSSSNTSIITTELVYGNEHEGSIKILSNKQYGNAVITLKTIDGITKNIKVNNNVYKVNASLASTTRMGACVPYNYGNKYEVYLNDKLITNWDNIIIGNNTYTKDNSSGSDIITTWQGQSIYVTINGTKYSAIFTKSGGCN